MDTKRVATVVVIVEGGVVQSVLSDAPDVDVRVLDWDREGEARADTAAWLWSHRDILRRVGPRTSHRSSPGAARGEYALREELFPHALY